MAHLGCLGYIGDYTTLWVVASASQLMSAKEVPDYIEGMPEEVDAGGDRMGAIVEHTHDADTTGASERGGDLLHWRARDMADIVGGESSISLGSRRGRISIEYTDGFDPAVLSTRLNRNHHDVSMVMIDRCFDIFHPQLTDAFLRRRIKDSEDGGVGLSALHGLYRRRSWPYYQGGWVVVSNIFISPPYLGK